MDTCQERSRKKYNEIFDDKSKIKAFDKIAEKYYFCKKEALWKN